VDQRAGLSTPKCSSGPGEHVTLQVRYAPQPPVVSSTPACSAGVDQLDVNTRDAMPGGGQLTIQTELVELDPLGPARPEAGSGRCLCLKVTDTGHGMTSHSSRIFGHLTTKEVGEHGPGLATVYGSSSGTTAG
jgi:hypothetical protein